MPTLDIFVSFEFDKDKDLQNNFYRQAKQETQHRIRDCSLHETYPDEAWKNKARNAIRGCDVVVVLIGQNTHNAPGVIVETDMARSFEQAYHPGAGPEGRPYQGLTRLGEPITWRWSQINEALDAIANRRG